jgi:hypothetical protein
MHHAPVAHHGRNGVFKYQLLLAIVFQQHRIFVEGPDFTGKLHAAYQVNRDRGFVLTNGVQKRILNILCRLVLHVPISCSLLEGLDATSRALKNNEAGAAPATPESLNPAMC